MNRRRFLAIATLLAGSLPVAARARAAAPVAIADAALRGSLPATDYGVRPDPGADQSAAFRAMLRKAAQNDTPLFLPAGDYIVSDIELPARLHLEGVPGRSRIIHAGGQRGIHAEDGERIALRGLVIEGAGRSLGADASGLLDLRGVASVSIDDCTIAGSAGNGLALERCGGRIERTTIANATEAGLYAVQSTGLRIAGNTVRDCGNGGILVHRWEAGEDGTIVTGNRVERIAATNGGTGQFGNGINVYRAGNVIISNNRVADCAFSAIRANSGSDVQIVANNCLRSGETGIYSEFSFEGAVVADNIVDGAANGISIVNFDKGGRLATCTGNVVRNLKRVGPYAADPPGFGVGINIEADSTVSANVIEDAPTFGIAIGWGPYMRDVVATGNVIRQAGTGIAVSVVEGTGSAVISNNVIRGTPGGAVVGYRWADAATGDLTADGAEIPRNLTVSGNQAG